MIKDVNLFKLNIFVFLITVIFVFIGLYEARFAAAGSLLFPAAGVYTGLFYIHRRKVLPGLLCAIVVTNIVFRLIYSEEELYITITLSVLFSGSNLFEMFFFKHLMEKLNVKLIAKFKIDMLLQFVIVVTLTALSGALIGTTSIALFYGFNKYFDLFIYWFIGSFMGILIFGSVIINSLLYDNDENVQNRSIIEYLFYYLGFVFLCGFILLDIGNNFISLSSFQILFVVMYVLAAFRYSFFVIFVSDFIIILFANLIYLPSFQSTQYNNEAGTILIILAVLGTVANLIRLLLIEKSNNFVQMQIAKQRTEKIISSTAMFGLFKQEKYKDSSSIHVDYLKTMFEIACEIYDNFDKASCNVNAGKYVRFVAAKGYDLEHLNALKFLTSSFHWDYAEPVIVGKTEYGGSFEEPLSEIVYFQKYGEMHSSIRFSILISNGTYGTMSFDLFDPNKKFTINDLERFKSFQAMINSFYQIGILKSETDILKDDVVLSLVRALGLFDVYTSGHSEKVAELSSVLADKAGVDSRQIKEIYLAGIVHDIGKLGLPYDILNKPGKLTVKEYEILKQHSVFGYEVLSKSNSLVNISKYVKHHHEWYDGTGYPDGLRDDQIPYASQILCICDAVDAMGHDRIYHKALTLPEIIKQLELGKGTQFNPDLVEKMVDLLESGTIDL